MNTSLPKLILLIALLCTVFTACKKDHPADTECRLTAISKTFDSNQSTLNFQYNADGTVMALNSSGFDKENSAFTWYGKNNVLIKRFYAPTNQSSGLDSLTLNNAGHIINTRLMASYRTDWTNWSYTLNATNEVQSVLITTSGGKTIPPDAYVYTDGNLVQLGSTKYTYDTTKPACWAIITVPRYYQIMAYHT